MSDRLERAISVLEEKGIAYHLQRCTGCGMGILIEIRSETGTHDCWAVKEEQEEQANE